MDNNLILVADHFKRLRNFGYGFHTCIENMLINLYDINLDDGRTYHHLFKYNKDVILFKYPILLSKELAVFINAFIKDVDVKRKEQKKKPKEIQVLYAIRDHETYIDFLVYVEGMEFPSRYMKINLLTKDSLFYKNQLEIFERLKLICPDKREIVEYSVDASLYDILKTSEDVHYIDLEIGDKVILYPLAISIYFSLRNQPNQMNIEIANTKNESIFMVSMTYDTEFYSERHISFVLHG